jgi:hypothetical protein
MVVHEVRIGPELCIHCGKNEGRFQEDPFAAEIHGDVSLYFMCDECAEQFAMDI